MARPSIVVTSISAPNPALREIASGATANGFDFIVIGDAKSPPAFELPGCDFHGLDRQRESGLRYAELCPSGHYARKNIGYLLAMRAGASLIVETDDDNFPRPEFWSQRDRSVEAPWLGGAGWLNVYRYFTDALIWPRGLPLDAIKTPLREFSSLEVKRTEAPIQQGLADANPDVDALYRLVLPLPQNFRTDRRILLGAGSWCPLNSQNTSWWTEAYPLLYLPAHCSFRMTDIWRGFIAQKLAWINQWSILFHEPNVWQERNDHDLMRDFADEMPGYLHNRAICAALDALALEAGLETLPHNLRKCYRQLVAAGWIAAPELILLEAWLDDLASIGLAKEGG